MPYKTILVHLNNEQRVPRLLSAATQLALPACAHLSGLFVVPHVPYSSHLFPKVSQDSIKHSLDVYNKMGEDIHQVFKSAAQGLPITASWLRYEAKQPSYVDAVLAHARTVDLVIAAQKESDWDYADMFDVPDWLAGESGRPVVVVPRNGPLQSIGDRVLVAWNSSRESARAVFDALPLLIGAEDVKVLCVEEPDKPKTARGKPTAGICATLARHGVKCSPIHLKPTSRAEPGQLLLEQVQEHNSDLLVMGCYGRSRLREFLLGGASRYVLRHMTVPVLMAR